MLPQQLPGSRGESIVTDRHVFLYYYVSFISSFTFTYLQCTIFIFIFAAIHNLKEMQTYLSMIEIHEDVAKPVVVHTLQRSGGTGKVW